MDKKDLKPWQIVSETLKIVSKRVEPGVTTKELDELAEKTVLGMSGIPINKGYKPKFATTPFPATLCTSVNDTVVHGIPNEIPLVGGDIINLDLGVKKDGQCGDAAMMVPVGKISDRDERLIRYAKHIVYEAIKSVKAGVQIKEISHAIEWYAKRMGFITNLRFAGHTIGQEMHEDPMIPNHELPGLGEEILKVGQRICIEPMITYKDKWGMLMPDGWTVKTTDGRNSAFFEHMLEVSEDGCKVLTDHFTEEGETNE